MPRARDIDDVRIVLFDEAVQMNVNQVLSWRSSPMTEQARLNLFCLERLAQQRILKQIDLSDA